MSGDFELLKQSPARSVRLERRGERTVVVKRFEHSRALGRAFDRGRARREFEVLSHLSNHGLDVPRPLGIVRQGRAFEVELEWIEGARSLAELAANHAHLSASLASRLGRLLAGLHSLGVDHPDLHAGNVLITPQGRAIAIDFDKARLVPAIGDGEVLRDLVSLCAGMREVSGPGWRRLAFDAWWSALAPQLRSSLTPLDTFAIESFARDRRLRVVEGRARRWTRTGSAVAEIAGRRGFARVGTDPALARCALRAEAAPAGCVAIEGSRRHVLAHWRAMARLEEHGIPAPRCQVLISARHSRAWFASQAPPAPATPRERGAFLGQLLDRGLWCERLEAGDLDRVGLVRPRCLVAMDTNSAPGKLAPWLAGLDHGARQEFLGGLRSVWKGPARERATLSALLEHG